MPITKSAKKALRQSGRRALRNLQRSAAMRRAIKRVSRLVAAGARDPADVAVPAAYQAIDKAAKRGVISANTAARKKSKLMRLVAQSRG